MLLFCNFDYFDTSCQISWLSAHHYGQMKHVNSYGTNHFDLFEIIFVTEAIKVLRELIHIFDILTQN